MPNATAKATSKPKRRAKAGPKMRLRVGNRTKTITRPTYPKFITSAELRRNLAKTLDEVVGSNQPIMVRRHRDTSVALIDADYLEDILLLTDEKFVKSLKQARRDIAAGRTYTLEEVGEWLDGRRRVQKGARKPRKT